MKNVLVKLGSIAKRRSSGDEGQGPESSENSATVRVSVVEHQVARLKAAEEARKARAARLASLKPFCIDYTLIECLSTGYESLEDKLHAFKLLSRHCGLQNIVLAAFVKENTHDMEFLQALRSQELIDEHCFAVSELFDTNGSDLPGQDLPFGLAKMIQFGIQNAILECDLAAPYINWNKYSTEDFCALVESRCRWVAANLYAGRHTHPASYLHLRDFATAMQVAPARVLTLIEYLGGLDPAVRPRGVLVHETATGHFPVEAAPCVAAVRAVMDAAGWSDGRLLVHVQAGFGLAHATVLECLAVGCGGVMAALCEEAEPASNHASSLVDLANLSRLGNMHVVEQFDMEQLRAVAREVAAIMKRAADKAVAPVPAAATSAAATPSSPPPRQLPAARTASLQRQPLILGHA